MLRNSQPQTERQASTSTPAWRRRWVAVLGLAVATSPVLGAAAFFQATPTDSPATGDAVVVAQGVVNVPATDLAWEVTTASAPAPASAAAAATVNGFLVVTDGTVLVENAGSGAQERIAAGEAALTVAGTDEIRATAGATASTYVQIGLVPASEAGTAETALFVSEPFSGLDGNHDLDLVKDVMAAGETTVVGAGDGPSVVTVLGGAADVTTGAGETVSLAADQAAALSGELTVTAGPEGAVVVAAVIGPAVPRLSTGEAAATPVSAQPVTAAGTPVAAVTAEATVVPAEETSETAAPTVAAETTDAAPPADVDSDGDGLTDASEAELNADPTIPDTDGDGLTDGDEVLVYGTAVLAPDSDADGVLDGDEVAQGTDPLTAPSEPAGEQAAPPPAVTEGDSDGDGFPDALEFEIGTDAFNPDTDADGLLDGDEFYVFQTGTLNPDTDGDGVLDGAEIQNGTDPNDPNSF